MRTAVIEAIAHHLPTKRLTNADLAELYPPWTEAKILSKTGIAERRIVSPDECASDLAVAAVEGLLAKAAVDRNEVDLLVLCTQSPDYFLPTTACLVQDRLGLKTSTAAFDVNLGCSAYPYGLAIVQGLIESGVNSTAVLVTADTYSKFIHPLDKSVRTIFGDGATATLIRSHDGAPRSLGPYVLGTDGAGWKNLVVPAGGLRRPLDRAALEESTDESGNTRRDADLYMNGPAILEFTMRRVPDLINDLLTSAALAIRDIDFFVFHQANEFMLRFLQQKLGIEGERFPIYLRDCGNTVSSTIPLVLEHLVDIDRLRRGHVALLAGFGVGYSWGGTIIRWAAD